jgi:signal transduction histidine kinase
MTLSATVDRTGGANSTGGLPATAALAALPVGILIATPDGDWANPELRRLWGRPADEPLSRGSLWRRVEPVADRRPEHAAIDGADARPSPVAAALAGSATPPKRYRVHRDDGTAAVVRIETQPIVEDGRITGAILLAIDETAQHDVERLRDAFLGILGHELRTPVTAIVGGSYLVADEDLDPEVRREVATTLIDEAGRLQRLVDQLIDLASLERRGGLGAEPVALAHVVRRAVRDRRAKLPRLTIEAAIEGPIPPVDGVEGYVDQVLAVLLDNAVKYSGASARIVVRVVDCGTEVEVHVLDEGPGLPAVGTDAVFRLFYRAVPTGASARDGTGIGLFVARTIIEAMGGRIWAENRSSGGADVGFALHVADP